MVEFSIVIMLFLMLMFGTLEMAIAIFRYHLVSQGARQAARQAIVHGKQAGASPNERLGAFGVSHSQHRRRYRRNRSIRETLPGGFAAG